MSQCHTAVKLNSFHIPGSLVPRPLPASLVFQRATLKSWEWPGDEAITRLVVSCGNAVLQI